MPIERQSKKPHHSNFVCALCAQPLTDSNATKEHIIPNAIGGRKTVSNFICRKCNSRTGHTWDNELFNQLKPLCTMLNINRDRGDNQPITVETVSGRKLNLNPDGSRTITKPEFSKQDLGDKTEYKIKAKSMKELKGILSGLKKKHPHIDINELMKNAAENREYSEDPFCINHRFDGALAERSVIKSCLALAYESDLNIDDCEQAKSYLLSDGNECFGYFNEKDVVTNRPQNTFFHCIYICGDPQNKQVLAYAEYFGYQRIVACLSSNYVGEKFSHVYAIDPVTGKELDIEINLEIDPEEIPDIYAHKKVDWNVTKRPLEALLAVWKERDENRAISEAVEEALEFAFSKCGIVPGDHLTDENSAEMARVLSDRLAPSILRIKLNRTFSEEDLQKIVGKSQEHG